MTLEEMRKLSKTENVIFYKPNCPFCVATENLFKKLLENSIITNYKVYFLGADFNNQDLTELVKEHGWEPDGYQEVCTKPQIFINGKYVSGNHELYLSKWNLGEQSTGKIGDKDAPKMTNPMRF